MGSITITAAVENVPVARSYTRLLWRTLPTRSSICSIPAPFDPDRLIFERHGIRDAKGVWRVFGGLFVRIQLEAVALVAFWGGGLVRGRLESDRAFNNRLADCISTVWIADCYGSLMARRLAAARLRKVMDQRVAAISAMLCSHSCRTSPLR